MLSIKLVCVGGVKEKFFKDAQEEYVKRLSKFCKISVVEVKTAPTIGLTESKQIEVECENLKTALSGSVVCFDRRGTEVCSEDIAKMLNDFAVNGISEISFVIGGSYGLTKQFLSSAKQVISFGKITLPHTLFRVVALEQIYRAFTILNGSTYHK